MLPCRSMAGYNYEKNKIQTCINKLLRITFSYKVREVDIHTYALEHLFFL